MFLSTTTAIMTLPDTEGVVSVWERGKTQHANQEAWLVKSCMVSQRELIQAGCRLRIESAVEKGARCAGYVINLCPTAHGLVAKQEMAALYREHD